MLVNKVNDAGDRRIGSDKVGFLYKARTITSRLCLFDISYQPTVVKGLLVYCQVDSAHSAGADLCG